MTSPSICSSVSIDYNISSLRNVLNHRATLGPDINAVIDAFLAKTQHLQHYDRHKHVSGYECEYTTLCCSINETPGYKEMITVQTTSTKTKNRYRDVLPMEKTRVKLQDTTDDGYINANFIHGGYIACCAPVPIAIRDFWHMLWQCDVYVVLMLTNFVEQTKVKADIYWDTCPDKAVDFDGLRVRLVDDEQSSSSAVGYIVRKFRVCKVDEKGHEGKSRVIQHFQLTTWPDHGVLRDFQVIAPLLDAVNSYRHVASRTHQVEAKVVVHCSAGIGRSGTFIAIDILLKQLHRVLINNSDSVKQKAQAMQLAVNIPRVIFDLRLQRPGMVQTPEQYRMIYEYLAAVMSGNQPW